VHGQRHAHAALARSTPAPRELLAPADGGGAFLHAFGQAAAIDVLREALAALAQRAGQRIVVAGAQPVLAAELERIHAQGLRHLVHLRLNGKEALRRAVAAKRARHGQVGVYDIGREADVR